jgi:hypothetical protein
MEGEYRDIMDEIRVPIDEVGLEDPQKEYYEIGGLYIVNDVPNRVLTIYHRRGSHNIMVGRTDMRQIEKIPYKRIWISNRNILGDEIRYGDQEYGSNILLELVDKNHYLWFDNHGGDYVMAVFPAGNIEEVHFDIKRRGKYNDITWAKDEKFYYFFDLNTSLYRGTPLIYRIARTRMRDAWNPMEYGSILMSLYGSYNRAERNWFNDVVKPVPVKTYYTYAKEKAGQRLVNLQKVPWVSRELAGRHGQHGKNTEGKLGEFLTGKSGTVQQQREDVRGNIVRNFKPWTHNESEFISYLRTLTRRGGRRTKKHRRKIRGTHKKHRGRK